MTYRSPWFKFAALLICLLPLSHAHADVLYVFSGQITPYYFLPGGASQSFTYQSSSFITQDAVVPVGSLAHSSTGYYAYCQGIGFLPSSPGWGGPKGQVVQIAFSDGMVNPNYYFPAIAFDVYGTYTSVVYPGANTATLSVEAANTLEPGSMLLLLSASIAVRARARRTVRT